MSIESGLDKLHSRVTSVFVLQVFTVFTRMILAIGFIPPSIKKIMGEPFTVLPDSHPVGHYFNALYQTGFYYEFIGWSQLIAALLLIIPRTSHIGALLFLPIIVNIAVLTSSVGFAGTWLLTIFMALASLYLVAWDYDRLKPIVFSHRIERTSTSIYPMIFIPIFFAAGGTAIGILGWLIRLGNFPDYLKITGMLTAAGSIFGLIVAVHFRYMRVGRLITEN